MSEFLGALIGLVFLGIGYVIVYFLTLVKVTILMEEAGMSDEEISHALREALVRSSTTIDFL